MDFTQQPPLDHGIAIQYPELMTGLSDEELNFIIEGRMQESKTAYDMLKLDDRRKENLNFWLGRHYKEGETVGLPYVDPVIHRDTEQRIKMATGRMPDIILTPGDNSLNGRQSVKKLENVLDIDITNKEKKRIVKNGLRHNHIFLTGILKACWNPNKGPYGDYEFKLLDPRKVVLAHNGTIPEDGYTSDNIDLISEVVEEPLDTVLAKFPHKRQQLLGQFWSPIAGGRLPTSIRYQEIWYTYHKNGRIIEGTCWRYNNIILDNIRNPYFDFTGYDRVVYQQGRPVTNQFGQVQTEHVFRNFFERPRKPYILFSYQNLGLTPIDDTSAIEQAIPLQKNLNKIGKQIRDISDGITSKFVFSGTAVDQDQARLMTANPKEPIWLERADDVRTAVTSFTNKGPDNALFNEMIQTRQEIDALFQTQGTSRGEHQGVESGVSKQITREGDLVTSDDMVELVVERVIEEMGGWALQFMKFMYVQPHFKSKMGTDGEVIQEMIQRDEIEDGVALTVRSSTVDKNTARNLAVELGSTGAIDPLTMFEEMDVPNPKERAMRLLLFKMGEGETGDGYARYAEQAGLEGLVPPPAPAAPQGFTPEGPGTDTGTGYPPQGAPEEEAVMQALAARMV